MRQKYNALNGQPTNFSSLPRIYDNIWVEVGKAKGTSAMVFECSEPVSNHKLVYCPVTISGDKRV